MMCFLKKVERVMEVIKASVIDKLKSEAAKEVQAEFEERAKGKIKGKLRDLEMAKKVVANIERELEDLYVELSE
jgi:hypothetical protein